MTSKCQKRSEGNKLFREFLKFTADDWGMTEREVMETLGFEGSKDNYEWCFGSNDEEEVKKFVEDANLSLQKEKLRV